MRAHRRGLRRLAAMLFAAVLLMGSGPTVRAQSDDITGHWAEPVLRKWIALGWLSGDGAGAYRPNDSVSRAEYLSLVNKMKQFTAMDETKLTRFRDLSPDKWYYSEVAKALTADYLVGDTASTLSLEQPILRQEAFAMMARFEGLVLDDADASVLSHAYDGGVVDAWAEPYVTAVVSTGLVAGDAGHLYPLNRITRAETVVLLDRIHSGVRTFSFPGTFGPRSPDRQAVLQQVRVTAPDVTLRNTVVQQDLLAEPDSPGRLSLHNLRVFGSVFCNSRLDQIEISDCRLSDLELNAPRAEVLLEGGDHISRLLVSGEHTAVTVGGNCEVLQMTTAALCTLQLDDGIVLQTLTLQAAAKVTGGGMPLSAHVTHGGVVFDHLPKTLSTADGVRVEVAPTVPDHANLLLPEPEEEDEEDEQPTAPEPYRAVRALTLDEGQVTMLPGESRLLVKRLTPDNATDARIEWRSSDPSVVRVTPGGYVTAVSPGTATVTALSRDSTQSATCTVTVEGR